MSVYFVHIGMLVFSKYMRMHVYVIQYNTIQYNTKRLYYHLIHDKYIGFTEIKTHIYCNTYCNIMCVCYDR